MRLRKSLPSIVPHLGRLSDDEWRMLMLMPAYGFAAGAPDDDEGALAAWRERYVCALLKIGGSFGAGGIRDDAPCDSDALAVELGTREVVAYFAQYFGEMMELKRLRHVPSEVRSTRARVLRAQSKSSTRRRGRRKEMERWCNQFAQR